RIARTGPSAQAPWIISPDRRLELEMASGREGRRPAPCTIDTRCVPELRQALRVVEELLEHVQPVRPGNGVWMQLHREMPAALVLRVELGPPVTQERVRILEARALAREQGDEL